MEQKIVLITGGTKGIGLATAKLFLTKGYHVVISGSNEQNGSNALEALRNSGHIADFIKADLTREEDVNGVIDQVIIKYGRLDCLVNNVGGLGGRCPVESMSIEFWQNVIGLNLNSTFFAVKAAIPHLKINGGSIINVTSMAAYNGGGPGAVAYVTAKGAVVAFTKATAKELMPLGIRVNAVSPGFIDTDFHMDTNKELMESWKKLIPINRLGSPAEVAEVILFMVEGPDFLVGEVIQINGGQMFI